jgi:hypothetical protein
VLPEALGAQEIARRILAPGAREPPRRQQSPGSRGLDRRQLTVVRPPGTNRPSGPAMPLPPSAFPLGTVRASTSGPRPGFRLVTGEMPGCPRPPSSTAGEREIQAGPIPPRSDPSGASRTQGTFLTDTPSGVTSWPRHPCRPGDSRHGTGLPEIRTKPLGDAIGRERDFPGDVGVPADGPLQVSEGPGAVPRRKPGIVNRWWFWTAIGVVAAGAVTAGVLLGRPGSSHPDGLSRDGTGSVIIRF